MECPRGGARSRCIAVCGDELDTRLQDLPQRCGGRVRPAVGSPRGPGDQLAIPIQDERIEIADLRRDGLSLRAIAERLGQAPSTISRELRRNAAGRRYQPFEAHRRATARRARHHRRRIDISEQLSTLVVELLGQRWSPQQISRHLRLRFPNGRSMWLCHESIYQAVYQPNSRFVRPSRLAPHRRSPLRTGRDHRRAHQCQKRRRPRFQQPMLTIHDRHGLSLPSTGRKPGIGKVISLSATIISRRLARWSSARPACCGWCIFPVLILTLCTPHWWRACRICRQR